MRTIISIFAVACTLVFAGCGKSETERATEGASSAAATYEARGEFKGLDEASGTMSLHHEAIPTFVNQKGDTTGMMSMTMSFKVGEGLNAAELAVGDKIKFTFAVNWDQKPAITVTKFEKLPADTTLELGGH